MAAMNPNPYTPPADRWCSNCQQHKPTTGGSYLVTQGALRQRWICVSCLENRKKRISSQKD